MAACSHGAGYAKCPPAKVAREFNRADKGAGILRSGKPHGTREGPPHVSIHRGSGR